MIKRFVISNSELACAKDYIAVKSAGGVTLYCSPDLRVSVVDDDCVVIGNMASAADKSFAELYKSVKSDEKDIEDILFYMCGRYAVIYKNRLYTDAAGFLGTFYYSENGKYYISNDLTFYTEYFNKKVNDYGFEWKKDFINYMPAPLTTVDGVCKTLNAQYIVFDGSGYKLCRKIRKAKKFDLDKDELVSRIKECYTYLFRDIERGYDEISVALTGGVDSRTTFALMQNAGIKFSAFSHYVPKIRKCDITVPRKISRIFGRKYRYIKRGAYSKQKEEEYDSFLCKSVFDADRFVYSNGIKYPDKKGTAIIRSSMYECFVIKSYYDYVFKKGNETREEFFDIIKASQHIPPAEEVLKSLSLYYDFIKDELDSYSLGFLFFFQQREGSWLSYIERGYDLFNCEVFHPCNCLYIASLWASFPDEMRTHEKESERYLIDKIYPELGKIPYNSKSAYERFKRFVYVVLEKLRLR